MPKGQKTCPVCKQNIGPRAYTCKCGHVFYTKNTDANAADKKPSVTAKRKVSQSTNGVRIHWRDLSCGDFIKVVAGTGPYWKLKNGGREAMGYTGKFVISSIVEDGIHAYPVDKKNSGHCFIYMGPKKVNKVGMTKRPHKIRRLTTRPRITNLAMQKYSRDE